VGNPTQVGLLPTNEVSRDDATSRRGILMDEDVKELFEMFHSGEIDALELMDELDTMRFDGDIIDYL
jgi:hypothetical protein